MLLNKVEAFAPTITDDALPTREYHRQMAEQINAFLNEQNALGWRLVQVMTNEDLFYFEKIQ